MASEAQPLTSSPAQNISRAKKLQLLGILSGFTAGAWLGAAEAPTKLVSIGISPIAISLLMVIGVFLARWSLPALILGTSSVRADVRRAPHLIIWAVLAGCLWAVANTLTIFAIRDIGLSIAFPLWNSNSLLGIFWGFLFFNELRQAGWRRWTGVLGGALVMCAGATPLAIGYTGWTPLWRELSSARGVIFWLMLGGFIWVIGDLFQQYAAKYVGISRGIPLSNSNQLWGLLWGIFVFGELHGRSSSTYAQVVGGSLLMMLGVGAVAFSSASGEEQTRWKEAAQREGRRYGVAADYVEARMDGRQAAGESAPSRTIWDWLLVAGATAIFVVFASMARVPQLSVNWVPAALLTIALLVLLFICALALYRTTRFH